MASGPWSVCPRCALKVRYRTLRKEYTGLWVCPPCWDPKPPEYRPPRVKVEGQPLPHSQPEPDPVFRDENDPGGDDL